MKNASISLDPKKIMRGYSRFMHRFHVVVFTVLVLGGVAVVIFLLNGVIASSTNTTDEMNTGAASLDTATMDRIDAIGNDDSRPIPDGARRNPFVEN